MEWILVAINWRHEAKALILVTCWHWWASLEHQSVGLLLRSIVHFGVLSAAILLLQMY